MQKPSIPLTRLRNRTQVPANPLELGTGQGDGSAVLSFGDTEVLLVDVHELDIILADTVVLGVLKDEAEHVRRILRLQRQGIVVLGRAQHLLQTAEVDSQRDVSVAAELSKSLRLQMHRHQRYVRVVHRLQRDSRVIAVEVAILDQVLDGIDDLDITVSPNNNKKPPLHPLWLEHTNLLQHDSLIEAGFKHCVSNKSAEVE
jgi:hypothetical protein